MQVGEVDCVAEARLWEWIFLSVNPGHCLQPGDVLQRCQVDERYHAQGQTFLAKVVVGFCGCISAE